MPTVLESGRVCRIAVLLANNDQSDFSARFPSDAEKVCALLRAQRPDWAYEIYSVKDEVFPSACDADGYVITGSPASVHDSLPWISQLEKLIQELDRRRIPLVGLCFGHQLIAKALGGRVSNNPGGWRFGVARTTMTKFAPWMRPEKPCLELHACHAEQVTQPPRDAVILGGDAFCPVGAFAIGQHIFTTEYHPEFATDFMQALALEYRGEVSDVVLDAGVKQLQGHVDSAVFAKWMIGFFELERAH